MKNFHFFMFIAFNELKAARYIIHYFPLIYQFRLIPHHHLASSSITHHNSLSNNTFQPF